MEFVILLVALFLLFALLRPLTTLLHELGHAIPALLFTRGPVSVVIGVPKNLPKDPLFRLLRLRVWISRNPLLWLGGYCSHELTRTRWEEVIIVLNGVVFSALIAVLSTYLSFVFELHGFVRTLLILLTTSTVLDIFLNLVPSGKPVKLPDGRNTFNDGELIRRLLTKASDRSWSSAIRLSSSGKHAEAWEIYERALLNDP
ncbi:MAG TPA: hypothetical protein PK760_02295, partial [Flavobacteriales bacterium]|nr:hypothetical protein [Flavobacteriales bacterium]